MIKQNDLLNFWGTSNWKYLSSAFPILVFAFLFITIPDDFRNIIIWLSTFGLLTVSLVMFYNERNSVVKKKINFDKVFAFIIGCNLEFIHIDEFRIIIFAIIFILINNLPFLKYDFHKSNSIEIIAKLSLSTALAFFFTQIISIILLLVEITSFSQ